MPSRRWSLAHGRALELGPRAALMGVLNVTPDSFSDGGRHVAATAALDHALAMIGAGADIVDVGGESTRPGSSPVSPSEEQDRILPVIEALAAASDVLISVDTYRAETARLALAAGAHIVNDVWALRRDPDIARVAAEFGAGLVLMHNGRERQTLADPIADQFEVLVPARQAALAAGVADECIVLDPGFGFAKEDAAINLGLIARFGELLALGRPLLVGVSRKRFIGTVTGREPDQRDVGTAAANVALRLAGADIFRVHDVAINRDALAVADAILGAK